MKTHKDELREQVEQLTLLGEWIEQMKPCDGEEDRGSKTCDLDLTLRMETTAAKEHGVNVVPELTRNRARRSWRRRFHRR